MNITQIKAKTGGCFRPCFALLFGCLFLVAGRSAFAQDSIQMEESASPPKGVKQMAAEMKKAEEQKTKQAAGAKKEKKKKEKAAKEKKERQKYHGVFRVMEPLQPVVTLKSGNVKGSFINLANNTGTPAGYGFRRNSAGGYFLESAEQNVWKFEKVTGKVQYNRQLRNSLSVNSMTELGTTFYGTDLKYNRTVGRTGGGGSQNVADARKFSADYKRENGMSLSYNSNQNISRTISASPSKTNNKSQVVTLVVPFKKDGPKLTVIHNNTANRNITTRDVSKALQTDVKLDVPLTKKIDLNTAYQLLNNRNKPAASALTKNRKATRSVGMTYKISDDTKLTYLYNFSANHNVSTLSTNFHTTNRDMQFEKALSPRMKIRAGSVSTFDTSAGKTAVRTGSFSYDHKEFRWLPGSTSVDKRRQFTRTAGASNTNDTLTVSTPLSYFDGRLTSGVQHAITNQKNLISNEEVKSFNQTLTADYKFSKRFSAGTSLNMIRSGTFTPAAYSAHSVNHVRTDRATLDFGKSLSVFDVMENVKYNYMVTTSEMRIDIPTPGLTVNRVRTHALDFPLKGHGWTGKYNLSRTFSVSSPGQTQRALGHKFDFGVEDLYGCQLTANFAGTYQKSGSQVSELVKLNRKMSDKDSFFLSFETLRTKSKQAGTAKTRNRFFELGYESNF